MKECRKSVIHGDANDYNILVKGSTVAGLIDFGDMHYTHLINNLAINLAYMMMGKEAPFAAVELNPRGW